jgi:hypothetical protein
LGSFNRSTITRTTEWVGNRRLFGYASGDVGSARVANPEAAWFRAEGPRLFFKGLANDGRERNPSLAGFRA